MTGGPTLVCHNCLDPATSTGPRDGGTRRVALLRTDSVVFVFCSPACRHRWFSVVGSSEYDHRETQVADDVSPGEVAQYV